MKVYENDNVEFICMSDEFPEFKGKTFEGRIDGFYEKTSKDTIDRVLYIHFWTDKTKSGYFIGLDKAKILKRW